ncbi:unnamed protein product [Spirodela intermedia]|uniref:PHD-type domain-containing protein n=1 Tax=Spirodela intermedia TaxID=51605 RepID=A0A7I8KAM0_SPIIN|nr:unnamed protein product [Spirodela intermedia]
MPIKKIRLHPLNAEKDKSDGSDAKKVSLDSVRFSIGKALIRASRVPGPRQAAEDDGSLTKRPILARLEGNGCPGAVIEHSSPKMLKTAKYGVSSSDARQCSVSGDGRGIRVLHNDEKFKDQDEIFVKKASEGSAPPGQSVGAEQDSSSFEDTGFIKKLGSSSETDKTRSLQNSGCSERRGLKRYLPSEDIKTPKKVLCNNKKINGSAGQPINAEQGSSFFEGRKSLKKLGSSSVTDKIRKSPRNSRCSEKRPQKQYFPTEDKKTLKKQGSLPSSSRTVRGSLPSPSLSKDQKYLKKSSPLKLQKSQMRLSNFSSADESKVNMHDSLPPNIESDDENDFCNTGYNVTEASRVMTKAPLSSENDTLPESASRRTEKQTLRDQIKGMLLCAGWKIEMKRRKGKKYEDSVYVSPEGIGYWSITKAYGVLKEQINKIDELGNKKGCPGNSNELTDQFSVIPTDMLGILKRKIVKNRRFIGAEKFVGSKKTKCVTSSKSAKMKKVVAVKKEINENGIVGSSRKKNKNRRGCALLARNANQETDSEGDNYVPYAGRRSVLAWLLDSGTVPLNGKVKYMNKRRTWVMLEGLVTRDGILCKCCSKTLTVSKFEIHAGSKQKQPYENIFLEGLGISLLECQLDAWKKQEESKRCPSHLVRVTDEDPNDDTCGICGDGGNLICCDSCPATFHLSCLGIQTPPPGDWHCMNCLCRFCGRADSNTSDGHSLTGSLLLSCGQCGEKYHQVCMPDLDAAPVNTNHLGLSFCGQSCRMLFEQLQNLIGIKNDLEGGFSWTLVRRFYDDSLESCSELAQRVECNSKIAVALSVMDECFLPIIDQRSGINLITNVLYNCGSNFSRLDYQGFYTFILEQGDEILSAASIRIHGKRLAEMPFIGTRHIYRRQGMCRRLLNAIEEALGSLKIEKLVIPAISELMHTWTVAFGFEPLSDSDMQEIRNMNMLVFPGTGLLQKHLLRQESCAPVQGGKILSGIVMGQFLHLLSKN